MKSSTLLFAGILLASSPLGAQSQASKVGEIDPAIEAKIDALLAKMTLEEKVGQMSQGGKSGMQLPNSVEDEIRKGEISSFYNVDEVGQRNALQKIAIEESRLGIPLMFGFDVIHGQRTIFPVPLGEAASWNLDLMEKTARVAATEARALGIDWTFSPMVDLSRDPRWGRVVEGAGEDPYLGALIARAKVRGYQGDDLSSPDAIAACAKHFAAYGAAEAGREYNTTEVSWRTLRNFYLPPFKAAVEEGVASLMTGYNDLNGVPATASGKLQTEILRDEWGFNGFVVSDWASVEQLVEHGIAEDKAAAGVIASTAGVDMEMVSRSYIENLPKLVRDGKFSEKVLDTAVRRVLRIKYRLGLFDTPYVDPAIKDRVLISSEHRQVARESARESMVLLKNKDQLLPLSKTVKSIGLIGPLGDHRRVMLGTWSRGGQEGDVVTLLEGLKAAAGETCRIEYAEGCDVDKMSGEGFAAAIELAKRSDVVVMALGESQRHNGESSSRTNLDLPGRQKELLKEVMKTGKPVVLVLFAGRPLTINWAAENVPSILLAWHPGVEGGSAIADVLFGDYNPAGKITMTFPRAVGQIPIYYNRTNTGRPDIAKHMDLPQTPLFPFGFGLSYAEFKYDKLKIENSSVDIPGTVTVSADVSNAGKVAGHEVVQFYVRDVAGSTTRPLKELKGFERIYLKPGETRTVTFNLPTSELKFYGIDMKEKVEPGAFKVWVGTNSAEGLEGQFELR